MNIMDYFLPPGEQIFRIVMIGGRVVRNVTWQEDSRDRSLGQIFLW